METLDSFISRLGLVMESKECPNNPNMLDSCKGSSHWDCSIAFASRTMQIFFTQGAAYREWNKPSLNKADPNNPGVIIRAKYHMYQCARPDIRTKHSPVASAYERESYDLREARKNFTHAKAPKLSDVLMCMALDSQGYENSRDFEDWCSQYGYSTDSRKAEKTYNIIGEQAKKLRGFVGMKEYQNLLENVELE